MSFVHGIRVVHPVADVLRPPAVPEGTRAYLFGNYGYRITIGGLPLVITL